MSARRAAVRTIVLFAAAAMLLVAPSAFAVSYFADSAGGDWDVNTTWRIGSTTGPNPLPGVYPGSAPGDTASLLAGAYTVAVDSDIANAVTLTQSCTACTLDVQTGGTLRLTGSSSTAGTSTFRISGGTVTNLASLAIGATSTFDWAGGLYDGGGSTSVARNTIGPGRITVSSGANVVSNQTISVDGEIVHVNGNLSVNDATQITINANGLFELQTSNGVQTNDQAGTKITNDGTVRKTTVNFGTNVDVPVDNNNLVDVDTGALVLVNGTHTGTFDMVAGSGIEFAGTHTFDGTAAQIQGSGTALMQDTANISAGAVLTILANVTMGGTFNGPGTLAVTGGLFNVVNGTFANNLAANFNPGSDLDLTLGGNTAIIGGAHLDLAVNADVSAGPGVLQFTTGGRITVGTGTTLAFAGDSTVTSDGNASNRIDVNGTLRKSGGFGTLTIGAKVNNNAGGTIDILAGTMALGGGGTNASAISLGANTLTVGGGNYNFNAGTSVTGTGSVVVAFSATLTMNAVLTIPKLVVQGGTVNGSDFTVNDLLWLAGTIGGPGTTTATSSLSVGGLGQQFLDNRILVNAGTGYISTSTLNLNNGSTLDNSGTITFANGDIATNGSGSNNVNNTGTIDRNGTSESRIDVPLTMSGASPLLKVTAGWLTLAAGGVVSSGTIDIPTFFSFIDLVAGTLTMNGGTMTGTGPFRVDGPAALLQVNANVTASIIALDAGAIQTNAPNVFTIGDFQWSGGTLQGSGRTEVATTGLVDNTSATTVAAGHTFANEGVFEYQADNANYLTVAGTLRNESGATFKLHPGRLAGTGSLVNLGTFIKVGLAGDTTVDLPYSSTAGSIGVDDATGTLVMTGNGTITSQIDIGASSGIEFTGADVDISSPAFVTGTGAMDITAGVVTVHDDLTIPFARVLGGELSGAGDINLTRGAWTSGSITGPGTMTVTGDLFLFSGAKTLSRNLTNDGNIQDETWWDPPSFGPWTLEGGVTLTNNGTMTLYTGTVACVCAPTASAVVNTSSGSIAKNGAGTVTLSIPFDNDGTVTVNDGMFELGGSGSHDGDFVLVTNPTLAFTGGTHTLGAASSVSGSGLVKLGAPTVTLGGTYALTAGQTKVYAGSNLFNTTAAATTPALSLLGGFLGGTANFAVTTGPNAWEGGTIGGTGGFDFQSGTTTLSGTGPMGLDARAIVNHGTMNVTSPVNPLTFSNGASLANAGTFSLQTDSAIAAGTGGGSFNNSGTFQKSAGAGSTAFGPAFTTSNTVDLLAGTVSFDGGFTQTAGTTKLAGGNLASPATVNLSGGSLIGSGTVAAALTNSSTVAPGLSIGQITVTGVYTQTSTGILDIELTTGPVSDQLILQAMPVLDGTFNATLIGGYVPAPGDTFDVITWPTAPTTTFATVNTPAFGPNGSFTHSYTPASFQLVAIAPAADLGLSVSESDDPVVDGETFHYIVNLSNAGPDAAASVQVVLSLTNGSILSASGPGFTCTGNSSSRTCTRASFTPGAASIDVAVKAGANSPLKFVATVSSSTYDPDSSDNSQTEFTAVECSDSAPVYMLPAGGATDVPTSGTLIWNDTPGVAFSVFLGPGANGCNMPFGSTSGSSLPYQDLEPNTTYSWRIEASKAGCPTTSSACATFTTANDCADLAPSIIAPIGVTVASPITFRWTASPGATSYTVFVAMDGGLAEEVGTTAETSLVSEVAQNGPAVWYVVASIEGCGNVQSFPAPFDICNVPGTPLPRLVGQATSGQTYTLEWDAVPNAIRYEVDEATNAGFTGATTTSVEGTSIDFTKNAGALSPFFYRVRAFTACTSAAGGNSVVVRVVVVPLPAATDPAPSFTVPIGSEHVIVHEVFIPGEEGQTLLFTATTDREWLTVTPANGVLTPAGVTLQVTADPADLPNGTFTATLIVTLNPSASGGVTSHATSSANVPISISIVTPVTPVSTKPAASQHALVIPSVGHLDGLSSHWQSDIRLTNAGFQRTRYQLTFTPASGITRGVKQTVVTVDAGATTALDDIIRNWYGVGSLSDGANGSLEILPLDNPDVSALATIASSRTYNVTANGTLGQYVPAIPLRGFIGQAFAGTPSLLSIQQVAQSASFRTNIGIVEGTGKPANVLLTAFNAAGTKLLELPLTIAAGEQKQLNSVLAQNGISSLDDGRVEVKVTGGDGKVTAYASVVDNQTQDPLLVSGVALEGAGGSRYVLPGVAALDTGAANWRTDMRIFNAGAASQPATLTFFPQNNGAPLTANVSLNAGEVRTLDDIVKTLFGAANAGGAVHVTTPAPATLVVTARTYNRTADGTFGQFIPAVTPNQATARGERTLHILQLEDSPRFRTNIGLAEVTGQPVTVEIQVIFPETKSTPTLRVTLAPNEFRQFPLLRQLGLGNVYNARITVKVIEGTGRITAYGSVIDALTQDPTYVPAQ